MRRNSGDLRGRQRGDSDGSLDVFLRRFYKDMNAKGLEKKSNFELLE